jgi:hypothetical protein
MVPKWLIAKRREIMKRWQPIQVVLILAVCSRVASTEEVTDESLGANTAKI